ncbi:MAG TPA: universal stress protein [Vicinamibacterales bacterium]|nr:universal stress protein [Vicinamibacterales bacterium]
MTDLNKILVPTDFSDASAAALKYACGLADALHAELSVLHVVENPYPLGAYTEFYTPPVEFFERRERQAREQLDAQLTPEQKERYHASMVLRHGEPVREILQYLHEHGAVHMIVMATHGRGGVARLMMGSVADKMVRMAPCPVVTVRVPEVHAPESTRAA